MNQYESSGPLGSGKVQIFYKPVKIESESSIGDINDVICPDGDRSNLVWREPFPWAKNKIIEKLRLRIRRNGRQTSAIFEHTATARDFTYSSYGLAQICYFWANKPPPTHFVFSFGILRNYPRTLAINQGIGTGFSGIGRCSGKEGLPNDNSYSNKSSNNTDYGCPHITAIEKIERISLCLFFFALSLCLLYWRAGKALSAGRAFGVIGNCLLGFVCFLLCIEFADASTTFGCSGWRSIWRSFLCAYAEKCDNEHGIHGSNTVTQKYLLTTNNYCNTLIAIGRQHMANVLNTDKQIAVIGALAEGSCIRSIERITGVHRDTIMRLGVRVGEGCARLLDAKMRNLPCRQLQFDEIWGFIGKKERHMREDDSPELGDVWTFCAIDSDTKIVPSFKCGKRDLPTANAFVADVASRMRNRVQISSDALRAYVDAIETNFGADVDFAQIIKTYVTDDSHVPERRFSAPEIVITEKKSITGFPDMRLASTSHVERLNGTTRLHMRRLTRLTYAFSKKFENFEAAVALHFAYYNFVKRHITLRATPAMAAGIEKSFWTVGELVEATA